MTACRAKASLGRAEWTEWRGGLQFRAEGLGLGSRVEGLGYGVWGLGFGVGGLRFGVHGLGFGVWGLGLVPIRFLGEEDIRLGVRGSVLGCRV